LTWVSDLVGIFLSALGILHQIKEPVYDI